MNYSRQVCSESCSVRKPACIMTSYVHRICSIVLSGCLWGLALYQAACRNHPVGEEVYLRR
ncbi:hypothetical protein BD311DRAFT_405746 [Dichomitus squalens]|uniref:Uncharacterized protein n=1 Tax=Dichomitus squalens TaxID=114155 RepID=A0A4Q9MHZ4_9APHY|nr:hypothetical protein BD311DRAFT_405746 [Dichomitus squalens]